MRRTLEMVSRNLTRIFSNPINQAFPLKCEVTLCDPLLIPPAKFCFLLLIYKEVSGRGQLQSSSFNGAGRKSVFWSHFSRMENLNLDLQVKEGAL